MAAFKDLGAWVGMECTHHRIWLSGSTILQMLVSCRDAVLYPQHLPRTLACMRARQPLRLPICPPAARSSIYRNHLTLLHLTFPSALIRLSALSVRASIQRHSLHLWFWPDVPGKDIPFGLVVPLLLGNFNIGMCPLQTEPEILHFQLDSSSLRFIHTYMYMCSLDQDNEYYSFDVRFSIPYLQTKDCSTLTRNPHPTLHFTSPKP